MSPAKLAYYSVMTGVDILMVSVLPENAVQIDTVEPCHEGNDKL